MNKQQGFTLIELMIVVAIIGILAAIAIPQYQNYVARAQLSEAMTLASGLKTDVAEVYNTTGAVGDADSDSGRFPAATDVSGTYVAQVEVTDGEITATMDSVDSSADLQGKTLSLEPDTSSTGAISWTCTSNIDSKYLPSNCTSSSS